MDGHQVFQAGEVSCIARPERRAGSTVCVAVKVSSPPETVSGVGTWTVQGNGASGASSSAQVVTLAGTWTPVIACLDSTVAISTIEVRYVPRVDSDPVALDSVVVNVDLLADGGFNLGTGPWLAAAGSTVASLTNGVDGISGEGTNYLGVTATATGGGVYQDLTTPVAGGSTYCLSGLVASGGGAVPAAGSLTLTAMGVLVVLRTRPARCRSRG